MIRIAIPLLKRRIGLGIVGPLEFLGKACLLGRGLGGNGAPAVQLELVGLNARPVSYPNGVTLRPHATIRECLKPELVLISGLGLDVEEEVEKALLDNRPYLPWIRRCYKRGATVASYCTGAFVLAETGLLDGKSATTHWHFSDEFRRRYPRVQLKPEQVIVDEGRIITAGAVTLYENLALHLVARYYGHEAAVLGSKIMLVDLDRRSQLPYTIFSGITNHGDDGVRKVQDLIERKYTKLLTIQQLAAHAGTSPRNFLRRFKSCTGETPSTYLQKVRIEAAKRLLERERLSVDEIRYRVGYEDPRSFRRLFKRLSGITPTAYRKKFRFPATQSVR